ncbi:integrin alpha-IIb isoform X1 [Megalops cyprinoides]|uniref:integrin alpha-IIb isoform X1 n=1 Tax=Megalops cyprinoides TaxID=118141 RepID=UPI001863EFD3|nr:integrin alpha-IIb isoform X1 [Megalops cyprinoides]
MPVCLLLCAFPQQAHCLNLDLNNFTVYSGPQGSYFGFSVDFWQFKKSVSVIVGAPKANTSQPGVAEGGAVFLCPWSPEGGSCHSMAFDSTGDEERSFSGERLQSFKSYQWFGASVRSGDSHILACAPLFHFNKIDGDKESGNTPIGNCQILDMQTEKLTDYAPCRDVLTEDIYQLMKYYGDKRYCEAGFSSEMTKDGMVLLGAPGSFFFQGQAIVANLSNILKSTQIQSEPLDVPGMISSSESGPYDVYQGYSVATGEFTGDSTPDYVVGVPNDRNKAGSVKIYNGKSLQLLRVFHTFYGTQVTAYFGHSVAVTDINNDGRDDVLIGAPLHMERQSSQHLVEVGQVCVYLQREHSAFAAKPDQRLTGGDPYGRFGSAVAPLGDLDMDGFNDIAVGAPFSGDNGLVFIFVGQSDGMAPQYTQVLPSPFHPLGSPAAFGFALRGGTDIDANGYPDLIVGAWGVSQIAVYRAQAVVRAKAQLSLHPDFLNPDEKRCQLPKTGQSVSCFIISMCVSVSGHSIPEEIVLDTELQLDKMKQKMARRTLFLQSQQPQEHFSLTIQRKEGVACTNRTAYLRHESEIRDKLSPIFIALNYSLSNSPEAVLHGQKSAVVQTRIILDCGEDNVCIPDLHLTAEAGTDRLLIGDENPVLLLIGAENKGEGAYETELQIHTPAHSHYQGVLSDREGFSRLVCAQKKENGTVIVVCNLGNPMKQGQQLKAGLYFNVGNLEEVESHVSFQMQIRSKNSKNPDSNIVNLRINVSAVASLKMRGGSSPLECVLPIAQWEPKSEPATLEEIGPLVEHVYELQNLGPGTVRAQVEVVFPSRQQGEFLLYVFANASEEYLTCHTSSPYIDLYKLVKPVDMSNASVYTVHRINKRDAELEPQRKETIHVNCSSEATCVRFVCEAPRLERGWSAVVKVMSRLWVHTFLERPYENHVLHSTASYQVLSMLSKIQPAVLPSGEAKTNTSVVWRRPDGEKEVPVWWIVVAIIAGLFLLTLLIFIFWKVGFFKRTRPPSDEDDDTEELRPAQSDCTDMNPSAAN